MSQRMYLPLDDAIVNVGYKSKKYEEEYGCVQYGTDIAANNVPKMAHATGDCTVEKIGTDTDGTMYCIVRYDDVECLDGEIRTIWMKIGHLKRCQLDEGDELVETEVIGSYDGGYLHVEMSLVPWDKSMKTIFNGKDRNYDNTIAPYMVWRIRTESNEDEGIYKQSITTNKTWIDNGWVSKWDILNFEDGMPSFDDDEEEKPNDPDEPDVPDTPDTPDVPDVPDEPDVPDTPDKPSGETGNGGVSSDWETRYKCLMYDLCVLVNKYLK